MLFNIWVFVLSYPILEEIISTYNQILLKLRTTDFIPTDYIPNVSLSTTLIYYTTKNLFCIVRKHILPYLAFSENLIYTRTMPLYEVK